MKNFKKSVNHFSIPFGTKHSFSDKTIRLLKNFDFKTIVSTEHGNFNKKKLFRIPRIGIGNNDLETSLYSKAIGFDSFINKILKKMKPFFQLYYQPLISQIFLTIV